jgi:hypothetical protein
MKPVLVSYVNVHPGAGGFLSAAKLMGALESSVP